MDEAWAAVLSGTAAALGGLLAGALTAKATVRQALTAGREQQRNWLLDKRFAAYTELLDAHDDFRERLLALTQVQAPSDAWPDEASMPSQADQARAWGQLLESRDGLAHAMQSIDLLGPKKVMRPVLEAIRQAVDAVVTARLRYDESEPEFPDTQWGAARTAFTDTRGLIIEKANQVLHSDKI